MRRFVAPLIAAIGLMGWAVPTSATTVRLVDEDGVIHLTNAPTDPRYRHLTGWTETSPAQSTIPAPAAVRKAYGLEVSEAAARYRVDPDLVRSVIRVESAFNPRAVSRKGAQGLMQLMPRTAAVLGVRNAFDPRQNIEGGVRHLRDLLDRYDGNVPLALAAYNAGAHAVDVHGGIPPYPETRDYVQRILSLYGREPRAMEPGTAELGVEVPQLLYLREDSDGTLIYTNVPPRSPRD